MIGIWVTHAQIGCRLRGVGNGAAVGTLLILGELVVHSTGQDGRDEEVLLLDLASPPNRVAELAEQLAACLVEVLPGTQRPQVSLHHRHAGDPLGVPAGVVQPQCDAPVVHHQPDGSAFSVEPRKSLGHVVAMDRPGVVEVGFAGTAHPDQVQGHASEPVHECRDHVAPQKRGRGIAVQKDQDRCLRIILVSRGAGVDHSHR